MKRNKWVMRILQIRARCCSWILQACLGKANTTMAPGLESRTMMMGEDLQRVRRYEKSAEKPSSQVSRRKHKTVFRSPSFFPMTVFSSLTVHPHPLSAFHFYPFFVLITFLWCFGRVANEPYVPYDGISHPSIREESYSLSRLGGIRITALGMWWVLCTS